MTTMSWSLRSLVRPLAVATALAVGTLPAAAQPTGAPESPLPPEGSMQFDDVPLVGWTRVDIHAEQRTQVHIRKGVTEVDAPGYRAVGGWAHLHTDDEEHEATERIGGAWRWWGQGSDHQHIRVNAGGVQVEERRDSTRQPKTGLNRMRLGQIYEFPPGRHAMYMMYGVSDGTETEDPLLEVEWEVRDAASEPYVDLEVTHSTKAWFEDDRHFDVGVQVRDDSLGPNTILEGRRTVEVRDSATGLFWLRPTTLTSVGRMSVDGPRSCAAHVVFHQNQGIATWFLHGAPAGEYTFRVDMVANSAQAATPVLFLADLPIPEGDTAIQPGDEAVMRTVNKTTCDPDNVGS